MRAFASNAASTTEVMGLARGRNRAQGGPILANRAVDSLMRRRLHTLIPRPDHSPELLARLAELPPEDLAALVVDTREPWWRRRSCALALPGRVAAPRAADLFARACDPKDVAEVRCALLAALAASPTAAAVVPLLTWLRGQAGNEQRHARVGGPGSASGLDVSGTTRAQGRGMRAAEPERGRSSPWGRRR